MRFIKFLLCAILVFSGALIDRAFAEEVLSWQDCVKEARQNHPDLVSNREKVNQAKADKGTTRSSILPQLSGSAGLDESKTAGKDNTKSSSYGISGRQLLFDGFKASNDLAAAQEKIKLAEYNYQVVSSNVRLRLWTDFIGLLSAQESLNVTKDIVGRRKQNLDLVTLRYEGGREHKGSLLTAQANLDQARFEYEQAERNVELYQRRLSKELGRSKFQPLVASGELAVKVIDISQPEFEALVESTPLLKQLVAKKEAARFDLKSAKSDFFPQIYADAGAGKAGSDWPPTTKSWSAGISVSFPIFEGGSKQASLDKAKATYKQVEADARSGRDGVILTLAETWTAWQNDVAQISVNKKFLEASQQRTEIVEAQYKSGLATFNDWTLIEDSLVKDQKSLLQTKTNALISEANWLQAKGETIDE